MIRVSDLYDMADALGMELSVVDGRVEGGTRRNSKTVLGTVPLKVTSSFCNAAGVGLLLKSSGDLRLFAYREHKVGAPTVYVVDSSKVEWWDEDLFGKLDIKSTHKAREVLAPGVVATYRQKGDTWVQA